MHEIQMTFYSTRNLLKGCLWSRFFRRAGELLDNRLSHLDTNDPVHRKVTDLDAASAYVCSIGEQESSRRLFGRFGNSHVEISISLFKDNSTFPNSISFHFPAKDGDEISGVPMIHEIFVEGNRCFRPFYSFCDLMATIAGKRKPSGYAVDLQAELIGVFWLTYFSNRYIEFFGRERFEGLPCSDVDGLDGLILRLGSSPLNLDVSKSDVETKLGKQSFVDPALKFDKPVGKSALEFKEL